MHTIGHRLTATKVYEKNVLAIDWHVQKKKALQSLLECFFSLSKQSKKSRYINKSIWHYAYLCFEIWRFLWSALCVSNAVKTVLKTVCLFLFLFSSFLCVTLNKQLSTCPVLVDVMKNVYTTWRVRAAPCSASFCCSGGIFNGKNVTCIMSNRILS